jgi:hypothetical protein
MWLAPPKAIAEERARTAMREEERETIGAIANQVRDYLSAHPNAADTLEGITGWWLPQQGANADPELVQRAIDDLVARQEVTRIQSADGHVLYTRAQR